MARDTEIKINLLFDGDYLTAYRELIERATTTALAGDPMDWREANNLVVAVNLAAEIRQGLAAGHLRTPAHDRLTCSTCYQPLRRDGDKWMHLFTGLQTCSIPPNATCCDAAPHADKAAFLAAHCTCGATQVRAGHLPTCPLA